MRGSIGNIYVVIEGPEVLHDVELATGGPADRADVLTQHPKCRPNAFAIGQLQARHNPAVLPVPIRCVGRRAGTAGLEAGRGVVAAGVADGADD